jgi:hypothetical protein
MAGDVGPAGGELVGEFERYRNINRLHYVRGSEGSSWSWPSGSAEGRGRQAGRGGADA